MVPVTAAAQENDSEYPERPDDPPVARPDPEDPPAEPAEELDEDFDPAASPSNPDLVGGEQEQRPESE